MFTLISKLFAGVEILVVGIISFVAPSSGPIELSNSGAVGIGVVQNTPLVSILTHTPTPSLKPSLKPVLSPSLPVPTPEIVYVNTPIPTPEVIYITPVPTPTPEVTPTPVPALTSTALIAKSVPPNAEGMFAQFIIDLPESYAGQELEIWYRCWYSDGSSCDYLEIIPTQLPEYWAVIQDLKSLTYVRYKTAWAGRYNLFFKPTEQSVKMSYQLEFVSVRIHVKDQTVNKLLENELSGYYIPPEL